MPTYQFEVGNEVKFTFELYAKDKETSVTVARRVFYNNKTKAYIQSQELGDFEMCAISINPNSISVDNIKGEF